MIPKKLATRITALVMVILIISVIILVGGANWITKSFYQDHLTNEIEGRIISHAKLLSEKVDDKIIQYIDEIETKKSSYFMLLDAELVPYYVSESISKTNQHDFLGWINENRDDIDSLNNPYIDHVNTSMQYHIPHIWALMPIVGQGNEDVIGYVFLDQDTGDLNQARSQLIILFVIIGVFIFIIGFLFTTYITKRISKPLNHIREKTKFIADGDFDIELNVRGEDEVSHLAESIQSMTNQLKEYRDSRRHFISHISHDLRTPITYIKGYAAVMKEAPPKDDGEEWKRNLNVIYNEATRMEHLVSDLFLLTKLEEGKIKLELELVPIVPWIQQLYQSRALMFDQKSIMHQLVIPEDLNEMLVLMDTHRIEQALINLLENAIRHTPKEGKITLFIDRKGLEVVINVQDTGAGIAHKDLPYIWERFYKADSSRNRSQSGTGLGLAIVKEIVEAHKGKAEVISTIGKGSTFSIYLPLTNKKEYELKNEGY